MWTSHVSRRDLLLGSAALLGCGRQKGTGFPGYALVANEDGPSVAAIDLTRFAVTRQIPLGSGPSAVIAHPQKPVAYVLTPRTGTVYEIDGNALSVRRKSRPAGAAIAMRLAPDGESIWLLCSDARALIRLSLDNLRATDRIRLPGVPEDFDVDRDGHMAAISFVNERTVGFASLEERKLLRAALVGSQPRIVRFRSDGHQILVGDGRDRTVTIVDVKTGREVVRLPLPLDPVNFCSKPDGGELYVTGPGMDAVSIIFPYSTEVGEAVLAGRAPASMAVCPSPLDLFVANPGTGDVTVLDIESRKLVATVNVGEEPHQIVITPDNQYALVLNRRSGDVAVIRIAALSDTEQTRRYKMAPLFTMIPVGPKPVSAAVVTV